MQVGVVTPGVQRDLVRELVELDHLGDDTTEELAIVAHQGDSALGGGDEPFEPIEAVEVEVVGRLVEQQDVELRQHQRCQADPRRFAARQRRHRLGEQTLGKVEVGPHRSDAHVEVGRAERQPPIERVAVPIVRAGLAGCQLGCRRVQLGLRSHHAGSPADEVSD